MSTDAALFLQDHVDDLVENHHECRGSVLVTALDMALHCEDGDVDHLQAVYENATDDGKAAIDAATRAMLGVSCRAILEADRRLEEAGSPGGSA